MKTRVRKVVNFFAFNLLFFALYLNFIHNDKNNLPSVSIAAGHEKNQAVLNADFVESTPKIPASAVQHISEKKLSAEQATTPLRLSIN